MRSVRTPTGQHYDWVDFRWLIVTRVPEELRNLPGTSVVILFDTSGSMKETIAGGKRKIDVAKDAAKAVLEKKTAATNLEWALFTFRGSRPNLAVPFQEDTRALLEAVSHLAPDANTPLAATMRQAGEYALRAARYNSVRIIILSDGQETCGGDPAAEARRLKELFEGHEDYKPISRNPREPEAPAGMIASESPSILGEVLLAQTGPPRDETKTPRRPSGKRLEVTVIGLDIKDAAEEKKLKAIAEAGGGRYLKVDRVEELAPAIEAAVEGGSEKPFDEVSAVVMLCILLESALLATMVSLWVYHRRKRPLASVVPLVKLRPADASETAATEEEKCLDLESA